MFPQWINKKPLVKLTRSLRDEDDGMSTAEYAIGTIAAAALAAVLYSIVTGDTVADLLNSLIRNALVVKPAE